MFRYLYVGEHWGHNLRVLSIDLIAELEGPVRLRVKSGSRVGREGEGEGERGKGRKEINLTLITTLN